MFLIDLLSPGKSSCISELVTYSYSYEGLNSTVGCHSFTDDIKLIKDGNFFSAEASVEYE